MDQVARAVLVLQLTDSAVVLSFAIAARLLPILLFGLVAGAVADRWEKRRLLTLTQLVSLVTSLSLGIATVSGHVQLWHVFTTAFVGGTALAFNQPVRQALIPELVPRRDLVNAIALNQAAGSFTRIGASSFAGILLIRLDVGAVFLLNALLYAAVVGATLRMTTPPPARRPDHGQSLGADMTEGFRYVASNPILGTVTVLALILYVVGLPFQHVFTPLLATSVLNKGASGIGILAGATGLGAFLGSIVVAWRADTTRPGTLLVVNLMVFGTALSLTALQNSFLLTAVLLGVCGAMSVTFMAYANGILLSTSQPQMHGRVMSLLSLDRGLVPVGAIVAGLLVSATSVQAAVFIHGATVVVIGAVVALLFGRRLGRIGRSGID